MGLGVDFHVGAVTREHDDIDLAIWLDEAQAIGARLEADGWRDAPTRDEDGGTGYERGGVRLELTYIASDDAGRVFVPLRASESSLEKLMPKMHADEVDTDPSLVCRLLAAQFPQWAELPIEPVDSAGTDNALYRLGEDMVVRLPRVHRATAALDKEVRWLPTLAPLVPVAIPIPLAVGKPAQSYPFTWSIYTWLEGETATRERIADLEQAATDLAAFVAAMQRVDPREGPAPGQHNVFRGVPLAMRDESTRGAIASLGSTIDVGAVMAAWEAALQAPEWRRAPVWIHGDLDSRNLLVERGRLSAVIDFGCLGVGDPACDVMVVWKILSADTRELFRAELSVDDATWARSRGWALSQGLIALAYYTLETNAVLVREAQRWMDEVLADHTSTSL